MKVLFIVTDFDMGGITSSLRNLSNELIARGHQVDVLNLPKVSNLPEGFDSRVGLVEIFGRAYYWNLSMEDVKVAQIWQKPILLMVGGLKKILSHCGKWEDVVFGKKKELKGYDMVVGFRQGPVPYYMTTHKADAKCKVGFWHIDPDYMGDISKWDKYIYDLDKIAGVSNAVCKSMIRKYPCLRNRMQTVYNIFDAEEIIKRGKEVNVEYLRDCFNIVTVARVEFEQKQLQMIPTICKRLKEEGLTFNWTIVGDGPDMLRLRQLRVQMEVEDCLFLVGEKRNPYPYVQQAELFVLTSLWESYGMVIEESLILGTPVVAGDYPALKEILKNDVTGVIAINSVEGIYNAVKKLITDKNYYKRLKENCMKYEYNSDIIYQQFLTLLGEENAKI